MRSTNLVRLKVGIDNTAGAKAFADLQHGETILQDDATGPSNPFEGVRWEDGIVYSSSRFLATQTLVPAPNMHPLAEITMQA